MGFVGGQFWDQPILSKALSTDPCNQHMIFLQRALNALPSSWTRVQSERTATCQRTSRIPERLQCSSKGQGGCKKIFEEARGGWFSCNGLIKTLGEILLWNKTPPLLSSVKKCFWVEVDQYSKYSRTMQHKGSMKARQIQVVEYLTLMLLSDTIRNPIAMLSSLILRPITRILSFTQMVS